MRNLATIGILVFLFFSFTFLKSCEEGTGRYHVEYEVTGDATFVTYFTPKGELTENGISTPWTYSFKTGDEEQIIKMNAGSGGGSVYVKIFLDGEMVLSDSESNGLIAITGTYRISDFI